MFENCDYVQCALISAMLIIVILIAVGPREKFDTSVAVRSQVGDSINVDTILGKDGSLTGDVYNCGAQINTVQPDNAWSWVDSAEQVGALGAADSYGAEYMVSSPPMLKNLYREKQNFMSVPRQDPIYNSTKIEQLSNSMPIFRESLARDGTYRAAEGFGEPSRLSEQALSVLMPGGTLSHFRPARLVQ